MEQGAGVIQRCCSLCLGGGMLCLYNIGGDSRGTLWSGFEWSVNGKSAVTQPS